MFVVCMDSAISGPKKNINADHIKLLHYFNYAGCIVPNTFHGCVMSLIIGEDMAVFICSNANMLLI